jgi:poly-beta-1,6-N-acetyl-D-glucosamine N-deacetylase
LKRKLRDITAACLGFTLIAFGFVNRTKKKIFESGSITGIYFHNPQKRLFEKSIKWLIKNGFTIITAGELVKILQGTIRAAPGSVWISLDDGWKENMANVVPVAAENKIPVTFFISTGPVEAGGFFWWSAADKYRKFLSEPYKSDIEMLWKVSETERAEAIKELYKKINGGKFDNLSDREAMTIEDVKKIAEYDTFTIGSHTINHVITSNCNEKELKYELDESKRKLQEWTGREVNIFSYPNGDYEDREKKYLKQSDYIMATVQDDDFITTETDIYKVPRFSVGEGYFAEELCHMFGVWQNVMGKLKGGKKISRN